MSELGMIHHPMVLCGYTNIRTRLLLLKTDRLTNILPPTVRFKTLMQKEQDFGIFILQISSQWNMWNNTYTLDYGMHLLRDTSENYTAHSIDLLGLSQFFHLLTQKFTCPQVL